MTLILIIILATVLLSAAIYAYIKTPIENRSSQGRRIPTLNKNDCCKNCASNKIIRGRISGTESSTNFYSSEFKSVFFSSAPQPLTDIDKGHFDFCVECGYVGGFFNVSNIQQSLKVYGKQTLLDRLEID